MMISTTAKQEPGILKCLADKYGHQHLVRLLDNCSVGPDRVSVAPRADKYGDVSERLHEKRRDRNEPSGVGE